MFDFDAHGVALLFGNIIAQVSRDACLSGMPLECAGHLSTTDLANYLVREASLPFQDTYHITGALEGLAKQYLLILYSIWDIIVPYLIFGENDENTDNHSCR